MNFLGGLDRDDASYLELEREDVLAVGASKGEAGVVTEAPERAAQHPVQRPVGVSPRIECLDKREIAVPFALEPRIDLRGGKIVAVKHFT